MKKTDATPGKLAVLGQLELELRDKAVAGVARLLQEGSVRGREASEDGESFCFTYCKSQWFPSFCNGGDVSGPTKRVPRPEPDPKPA